MGLICENSKTIVAVGDCANCHYNTLIKMAQMYDVHTGVHLRSAEKISVHIATQMGLQINDVIGLSLGAVLHDVGKLGVPQDIIRKPGKLTPEERITIEEHAVLGKNILDNLHTPWNLSDYALMHHERLDGSGYPNKLTADDIPTTIRILTIADVLDAITADRPYRERWTYSKGMDYLYSCEGQFDTDILKIAETYNDELYKTVD